MCECFNCYEVECLGFVVVYFWKKNIYSCYILGCGKVYGKIFYLKVYLCWYMGEWLFVCNWLFCGKRFMWLDEL